MLHTYRTSPKLSSEEQKCLEQAAASDARVYNFSVITEERKWVQVREKGGREGEMEGGGGGGREGKEEEVVHVHMYLHRVYM